MTRRAVMLSGALTLLVSAPLLFSCGSELRRARTQGHPESAETDIVDFPPPPAEVEEVPPDPGPACVWVDGRWEYVGRRWEWHPGAWVQARAECYYAPPIMFWSDQDIGGNLNYRQGRWYTDAGAACAQPTACRSASGESDQAKPKQ